MKSLFVILGLVATATFVNADSFGTAGTMVSNLNLGGCSAIVDNSDNSRDTCLIACSDTSSYILNTLFNTNAYTDKLVSPTEFYTKLNAMSIYANAQINQCRLVELMQNVDKRFSVLAYSTGLGANLAAQVMMYKKSAFWTLLDDLKTAYNANVTDAQRYRMMGGLLYGYLTTVLTYSSPSAAVGTKPY
jgi:hypothetical protein